MSSKISILENELEPIKNLISGGGGIVDSNVYLTTEDGNIFITEDGIPIISEESISDPNPPIATVDRVFLMENGDFMIAETGEYFELETKTIINTDTEEDVLIAIYNAETEVLSLTSKTKVKVEDGNLIITNDNSNVSNEVLYS